MVCVGFAKSGTTLLHHVLDDTPGVAVPRRRKELKFFLSSNPPAGRDAYPAYLAEFFGEDRPDPEVRYTFEATPQYADLNRAALETAMSALRRTVPGPRIVLCVRHPVVRAYSHYLHNLHRFGLRGAGVFSDTVRALVARPYGLTFEEALATSRRSYADVLETLYDTFGRRNVRLFFLETDAKAFRAFIASTFDERVAEGLPSGDAPPKVIARRPLPNYLVVGSTLHAFGSRASERETYENLSPAEIEGVLGAQQRWTRGLDVETLQALTDVFRDDLVRAAALSGDDRFLAYLDTPPPVQTARLTPVPPDLAAITNA